MGTVPLSGPGRGSGASRDGPDNGENVKEDDEEAADGGEEAEREGEEDATGGCTQEYVVAQKKHLVALWVW